MEANGRHGADAADHQVLHWPGRVVTAEELRASLNGHREIVLGPGVLVTALAADYLGRQGIRVSRRLDDLPRPAAVARQAWGVGKDQAYPAIASAVQALEHDGQQYEELPAPGQATHCRWARGLAEWVARGEGQGVVLFCKEPGLACCVANKLSGLRAVVAGTVAEASASCLAVGPNFVAVPMPGRTFFEVRQIMRTVCAMKSPACPPVLASTLLELDGHASR
jgi:hypothetical protein